MTMKMFNKGDKVRVTCRADGKSFIGTIVEVDDLEITNLPYCILDNEGYDLWSYSNAYDYTLEPVEDKPAEIPLQVGCRVRVQYEGIVKVNDGNDAGNRPWLVTVDDGKFSAYYNANDLTVLAPPPEPAKPEPWCKVGDWFLLNDGNHAMQIVRVEWDGNEWAGYSASDIPWYSWSNLKKAKVEVAK